MIKTIFKIIGLTLLIGYLLAAGIIYGFWREEPRYRAIKIEISYPNDDAHFITENSIKQLINSKPGFKCKGQGYKDVNTLELAHYIEENNLLVRHAACYHTTDSLLRIDIEQRNPILRVMSQNKVKDSNGHSLQNFYVDYDSEMMPAQFGTAICLPLATGNVRSQDIQPLHDFVLFLKENEFWSNEITQIHIRNNGDVELVPRIGDHTILLGSFENYEKKLKNVRTFYEEVLPKKGWNAYRTISVKFNGQVIGEK